MVLLDCCFDITPGEALGMQRSGATGNEKKSMKRTLIEHLTWPVVQHQPMHASQPTQLACDWEDNV